MRGHDISFGLRTPDDAKAWDTLMTLTATAKMLSISIYHSILDRISSAFALPDLADTITQRAAEQSLGTSRNSTLPVPRDYCEHAKNLLKPQR